MTHQYDDDEDSWSDILFSIVGWIVFLGGVLYLLNLGAQKWQEAAAKLAQDPVYQQQQFENRYVITDPVSGCEYLKVGNTVTPRLTAAGQPICRSPAQ